MGLGLDELAETKRWHERRRGEMAGLGDPGIGLALLEGFNRGMTSAAGALRNAAEHLDGVALSFHQAGNADMATAARARAEYYRDAANLLMGMEPLGDLHAEGQNDEPTPD